MNQADAIEEISKALSAFTYQVAQENLAGFLSKNRLLEDLLLPALAILLQAPKLRNLNTLGQNNAFLDLGDDETRIGVQVTTEDDAGKVTKTLQGVVSNQLYDKYDRIVIFMLKERRPKFAKKSTNKWTDLCGQKLQFIPEQDIIALPQLLSLVTARPLSEIIKIQELFAHSIFGKGSSELATTVHAIERVVTAMQTDIGLFAATISGVPESPYGRVLLRWNTNFIQRGESDSKHSFVADYSITLLTIEELVSSGAMELAVNLAPEDVENLRQRAPAALRNRIIQVSSGEAGAVVGSILGPALREFEIEAEGIHVFRIQGTKANAEVRESIPVFASSLYEFLLAITHRAQADIDLDRFLAAAETIRSNSTNADVRANIAVVENILRCYQPRKLESIQLKPMASDRAVELFAEFVNEHSYQRLSEQAHKLGYPDKLLESEKEFSGAARELVHSHQYQNTTSMGQLLITTATRYPDNSDFLVGNYLPPIVSFASARQKAQQSYELLKPQPIFPRRFE